MSKSRQSTQAAGCPCGQAFSYEHCCGRYHQGELPQTAEQLMRSRYSAYVLRNEPYLLATWASATRPPALELSADDGVKWLGLTVLGHEAGQAGDDNGTVRFVARYKVGGRAFRLQENSRFVREDGAWRYLDGEVSES
ncbi:YchJ family protein [Vogesella sp. LIG4]|uniref:YchJ family protein n=1 Tax=Vogesella sp. LIG4 TaxID=1192162 RepID=UPI00081FB567|nr:YchJ family metal-binding protein [Vogesella sp. LIG4]SCK20844.1 SEC-C motif-containing protein [Vogesella sp. LIG4]